MELEQIKMHYELKTQLIELTLSQKGFHLKSMIHLILLEAVTTILTNQQPISEKDQLQLEKTIIRSNELAVQTNKLVVLRYFLWKNGILIK